MTPRVLERQGELRRRWIVVASGLFVAAMIASTAHDLWSSRREAQRQAEQEIGALARVLAEQTRRSLQAVDVMLREIADARRTSTPRDGADQALRAYLEHQRGDLGDVSSVFLAGMDGRLLASSDDVPAAPGSVAESRAFRRVKAGENSAVTRVGP